MERSRRGEGRCCWHSGQEACCQGWDICCRHSVRGCGKGRGYGGATDQVITTPGLYSRLPVPATSPHQFPLLRSPLRRPTLRGPLLLALRDLLGHIGTCRGLPSTGFLCLCPPQVTCVSAPHRLPVSLPSTGYLWFCTPQVIGDPQVICSPQVTCFSAPPQVTCVSAL